jgi:hypothetical protein
LGGDDKIGSVLEDHLLVVGHVRRQIHDGSQQLRGRMQTDMVDAIQQPRLRELRDLESAQHHPR